MAYGYGPYRYRPRRGPRRPRPRSPRGRGRPRTSRYRARGRGRAPAVRGPDPYHRRPARGRWRPYDTAYAARRYRRWPRAYDAGDPDGDRRGRSDRRGARERRDDREEVKERPRRSRERGWSWGREVLRRYREPLVGLTVAGAMVPVAKAATQAPAKAKTPKRGAERVAAEETRQRDIEERLSQRWSAAEAESERETIIRNAMDRYGISRDLAADIHDIALEEGIEPELAYGLVNTESSFQPRAVSHVGARGYTQLMPATARWLQPGLTAEDLFDRDLNLHIGFQYLNQLIGDYDGDVRLALLAYNRGPGTVDRVLSQGGNPDNGYADKVLSG